ncbi:DUF3592 domain-containing protein [Neoroseomonas lacus]|uniref:DUF3592 domain-containing protein n=1 Tax=Neoroseomonas lacus TaxID=287609 RepID=A0A917NH90_9PROT|nr:DUF3592 domain-containing protein [Neoroseomonas lacus]GGI97815.1 hypothetical protein GCM10011320_00710 [Neoroseomonas lacus]
MRRILPALFLLIGLALLAGSGFAIWSEVNFRRGAVETDAQVVEMLTRSSRDRDRRTTSYTYVPVFVFTLPDGTKRRVEGGVASNPPCCTVGETIRIRYRPEAPEHAQMTGFMESWFVATLLGGMGLVFALVSKAIWGFGRPGGVVVAGGPIAAPANAMTFQVPLVGLRRDAMGWVLQARWSDPRSGVQRLFESPAIPFDPVPQMRSMTSVNVTFDPGDPASAYAMDLSFLVAPAAAPAPSAGPVRRG